MRAPTSGLLGLLAVSLLAADVRATTPSSAAPGTPLGFEALAVEKAVGIDVAAAHDRLTRLVATVRSRLSPGLGARSTLATVADAVHAVCPQFVAEADGGLYSAALASGACDCDILTVTYLTVGDALGLPLHAVFLPDHVLVLWDDGRDRIYWETTLAEARPPWAVEVLVPDGAERAYLRPQSHDQMVGYFHQVRANFRLEQGDVDGAFEDYATAERLNPTFVLTYSNRARLHLLLDDPEAALADFSRALGLDPTYEDALYGRALALMLLGQPAETLRDLDLLVEAGGASADVHHVRGLAHAALGREAPALRSYARALALDPTFALAYEARGRLHDDAGRREAAVRDYATFVGLASGTEYEATVPAVRQRLRALGAGVES